MRKYTFLLTTMMLIAFPLYAAEAKHKVFVRSADGSFDTVSGCNDNVVGVSVIESKVTNHGKPSQTGEVTVFGSFVDNCEFGTGTSFSSTVPLNPGEYSQKRLGGAVLNKQITIDGFQIELKLTWKGNGVRTKSEIGKISRDANVTGSFIINGLDQISGNTISNGSLSVDH